MNSAEEMCAAWLKHVERCAIVQMNYRASKFWSEFDWGESQQWCDEINQRFVKEFGQQLFGDTSSADDLKKLMLDAELDVVGIDVAKEEVVICEVADRRRDCKYGNVRSTIVKIAEKLVMAIVMAKTFFNAQRIHVYFVATVVSTSMRKKINKLMGIFNDYFEDSGLGTTNNIVSVIVTAILGCDIPTMILNSLLRIADDANIDDSFIRSLGLLKKHYDVIDISKVNRYNERHPRDKRGREVLERLHQFVQKEFAKLSK